MYRVPTDAPHPVDTAEGHMVAPGEEIPKKSFDEKHPHNAALLERGQVVKETAEKADTAGTPADTKETA